MCDFTVACITEDVGYLQRNKVRPIIYAVWNADEFHILTVLGIDFLNREVMLKQLKV